MTRTGQDAIDFAKSQNSWHPSGMCQQFTRSCFGVGSFFGSASAAWHGADKRHTVNNGSNIPAAVPVFWLGGSRGFGHVAFSLGDGLCRSTDWPSSTRVGTARIEDIHNSWGHILVGWAEDINNVTVWTPEPRAVLNLANIIRAALKTDDCPNGLFLKKAVAAEVGKGNMQFQNGVLGPGFRAQYEIVQRRYMRSIGGELPNRIAIDGIPGIGSLNWLGERHRFDVE